MSVVTMKALLESGVHFGHRTHRWHPHMKQYIFTERNGIHIINLQLTVGALEEAYNLVRETVAEDGTILFVGTKRQAQETIQQEATRCGMPYVNFRWLGGMLTNYRTIRERINELERLERMRDEGEFERLTKKEGLMLHRKIDKLEGRLSGVRDMNGLPDLLFAVDVRREETAIHEANLLEIPVIAMVDTNCDPRNVDYIIPSNDDAIRAIKLIVGKMADAVLEGKALRKEEVAEEAFAPVEIMSDEPELSDEDLLGEATLAKLRDTEEAAAAEEAEEEAVTAEAQAEEEAEGEAEEETPEEAEAAESVETETGEERAEAEKEEPVEASDSSDVEADTEEAPSQPAAEVEAEDAAQVEVADKAEAETEESEGEPTDEGETAEVDAVVAEESKGSE
jgi:small subunit ribosomal protein S2